MLRVSGDPSQGYLSVDKKRKQLTLQEPQQHQSDHHLQSAADDRRVGVSAPKMFAFDGLFTQDDTQVRRAQRLKFEVIKIEWNGRRRREQMGWDVTWEVPKMRRV